MPTEKIIMVDRVPEKLSDEEMKKIREEYAKYCADTYKIVQDFDIPNRDAKDVAFEHLLSPFQYFIEDKVRLKRLGENRLEATPQQRPQGQYNAPRPQAPVQPPVQEKPKMRSRF